MTWCVLVVSDDMPVSCSDDKGSWETGHHVVICQNHSYSHVTLHI